MNKPIHFALLAGAVIAAGVGVAGAAMQASTPAGHQSLSAHQSSRPVPAQPRRRTGSRFFAEYDLNKDGKITRDEFSKAIAQQFTEAAGGGKALSAQQYAAFRTKNLHQHSDQAFRRADWNGDGKLSFEEFASPIRASFERADRQSAGAIPCNGGAANTRKAPSAPSRGRRARGPRAAGNFCMRDDLNHDGKVTRAELDKALAQQFASAAKSTNSITHDQFLAMQHTRARDTSGRTFQRLDRNRDGKLTVDEFAASQQRTFTRMDRNSDGVITRDELGSSRRSYANRGQNRT